MDKSTFLQTEAEPMALQWNLPEIIHRPVSCKTTIDDFPCWSKFSSKNSLEFLFWEIYHKCSTNITTGNTSITLTTTINTTATY